VQSQRCLNGRKFEQPALPAGCRPSQHRVDASSSSDFPETLVWPLITDSSGKAEIKFNVADSITTWRDRLY
jgi:hypothetical protein